MICFFSSQVLAQPSEEQLVLVQLVSAIKASTDRHPGPDH